MSSERIPGDDLARREAEIKRMIRCGLSDFGPRLSGYRIFLFGSRACGNAKPRSDFDIGIDGPTLLPLRLYFDIEDRLETLPTLYRIDWVDFTRADARFRAHALTNIVTLYE
jgi:predicted nucleotidyltransferase